MGVLRELTGRTEILHKMKSFHSLVSTEEKENPTNPNHVITTDQLVVVVEDLDQGREIDARVHDQGSAVPEKMTKKRTGRDPARGGEGAEAKISGSQDLHLIAGRREREQDQGRQREKEDHVPQRRDLRSQVRRQYRILLLLARKMSL